jgi:hypothetical protein
MGTKSMSTCAALHGTQSMLMSSSSTPAVVPAPGHEEHVSRGCTMDTQSMLMSAASTPAVVPEHYGHEENVYPGAAQGTHRVC